MAPDNRAWQRVNENYPSEYKRLVQLPSEAHVQAARVMDRHLAEGEFTRDDLTKMSGIKMRNGETIDIERLPGDQVSRLKKEVTTSFGGRSADEIAIVTAFLRVT